MASYRKKSLRTCNDHANGIELDDMNSRQSVWSEAMRAEHQRDIAVYEQAQGALPTYRGR